MADRRDSGGAKWLRLSRPDSWWDVAGVHLVWFLGSGLLLGWSFLPPHRLRLPGPSRCVLLSLTGIPCPFCGGTRTFQALSKGEWTAGLAWNPLAAAAYFLVWLVFLVNLAALISRRCLHLRPLGSDRGHASGKLFRWLFILALSVVLGNWLYLCRRY